MLGEKLYALRRSKNISQEEFANVLNTSRQAISKWERNESKPDVDKLIKIAKLFNVSIDYLLSYEINYSDVLKIVCLGEIKKSIRGLYSTDVYFILKDNKKAYLSRRQFSKKQVLEIINTIREKNNDVQLGERLKRELKIN